MALSPSQERRTEAKIEVGDRIVVEATIQYPKKTLEAGLQGVVKRVDEDGDLYILFEALGDRMTVVRQKDLVHLKKADEAKRLPSPTSANAAASQPAPTYEKPLQQASPRASASPEDLVATESLVTASTPISSSRSKAKNARRPPPIWTGDSPERGADTHVAPLAVEDNRALPACATSDVAPTLSPPKPTDWQSDTENAVAHDVSETSSKRVATLAASTVATKEVTAPLFEATLVSEPIRSVVAASNGTSTPRKCAIPPATSPPATGKSCRTNTVVAALGGCSGPASGNNSPAGGGNRCGGVRGDNPYRRKWNPRLAAAQRRELECAKRKIKEEEEQAKAALARPTLAECLSAEADAAAEAEAAAATAEAAEAEAQASALVEIAAAANLSDQRFTRQQDSGHYPAPVTSEFPSAPSSRQQRRVLSEPTADSDSMEAALPDYGTARSGFSLSTPQDRGPEHRPGTRDLKSSQPVEWDSDTGGHSACARQQRHRAEPVLARQEKMLPQFDEWNGEPVVRASSSRQRQRPHAEDAFDTYTNEATLPEYGSARSGFSLSAPQDCGPELRPGTREKKPPQTPEQDTEADIRASRLRSPPSQLHDEPSFGQPTLSPGAPDSRDTQRAFSFNGAYANSNFADRATSASSNTDMMEQRVEIARTMEAEAPRRAMAEVRAAAERRAYRRAEEEPSPSLPEDLEGAMVVAAESRKSMSAIRAIAERRAGGFRTPRGTTPRGDGTPRSATPKQASEMAEMSPGAEDFHIVQKAPLGPPPKIPHDGELLKCGGAYRPAHSYSGRSGSGGTGLSETLGLRYGQPPPAR